MKTKARLLNKEVKANKTEKSQNHETAKTRLLNHATYEMLPRHIRTMSLPAALRTFVFRRLQQRTVLARALRMHLVLSHILLRRKVFATILAHCTLRRASHVAVIV